MSLSAYTDALLAAVRAAPEAPLTVPAATLGASPQRLGIYRAFVRDHITSVLAKLYPMTRALLAPHWDELTTRLLDLYPPRFRDLNLAGEPLPRLLDAHGHAFAASLAQLEWEIFATAVHPALVVPSKTGAPIANPTLSLFEQHHPAVQFLAAHDVSDQDSPDHDAAGRANSDHDAAVRVSSDQDVDPLMPHTPLPARLDPPQVAVVFRKPDHTVSYRVLDPLMARALSDLQGDAAPDPHARDAALASGLLL